MRTVRNDGLFRQHLTPYVDIFMAETHSSIAEGAVLLAAFADCGKPAWLSLTLGRCGAGRRPTHVAVR